MRRISKRSRWQSIRRNLLLGLLLALLQLLVLGGGVIWQFHLPWWLYVGAGAVFYLLIPGLAGFLAARNTGEDDGAGAGCLVGAVAILAAITAALFVSSFTLNSLSSSPHLGLPDSNALFFIFIVLIEGLCGTLVTVVGGSVGESLGKRRFLARYQSNKIAATDI